MLDLRGQELFIDEVDPFTDKVVRRTTFVNQLGSGENKINFAGYREGEDYYLIVGTVFPFECGGENGSNLVLLFEDKTKATLSDIKVDIDCQNKLDFYKIDPSVLKGKNLKGVKLTRRGKYQNFMFEPMFSFGQILDLLTE